MLARLLVQVREGQVLMVGRTSLEHFLRRLIGTVQRLIQGQINGEVGAFQLFHFAKLQVRQRSAVLDRVKHALFEHQRFLEGKMPFIAQGDQSAGDNTLTDDSIGIRPPRLSHRDRRQRVQPPIRVLKAQHLHLLDAWVVFVLLLAASELNADSRQDEQQHGRLVAHIGTVPWRLDADLSYNPKIEG